MLAAVDVRRERHAVVIELATVLQAKDLKTAGIGQDRSVPLHESMQAAGFDQ